jgi:hypothetical protein
MLTDKEQQNCMAGYPVQRAFSYALRVKVGKINQPRHLYGQINLLCNDQHHY